MSPTRMVGRRHLIECALASLACLFLVPASLAQESRAPVSILLGFTAGGSADFAARVLAERLSEVLARPVVVDNRPGAGGQIAAQALKRAPADGSVLMLGVAHTMAVIPYTLAKPGFDPQADFRAVANFANFELAVVSAKSIGVKNFADLGRWAKRQTQGVNIGVPSPAGLPDFMTGRFGALWKVPTQSVPYRGIAPLTIALLAGEVPLGMVTSVEAVNYGRQGKFDVLAVGNKTPLLPGVPSFDEVGLKGLEATDFMAIYVPAGTPDDVVNRLASAIKTVALMPQVVTKLRDAGLEPAPSTPAEQVVRLQKLAQQTKSLIESTGFKPE